MPPRRRVDVGAVRHAAHAAVERTSLRAVARRVGMSTPGLVRFLEGATPHEETFRKLREWYFGELATHASPTAEDARAVLDLLLESLAEGERSRVARKLLQTIRAAHREEGIEPPGWLQALCAEPCDPSGSAGERART